MKKKKYRTLLAIFDQRRKCPNFFLCMCVCVICVNSISFDWLCVGHIIHHQQQYRKVWIEKLNLTYSSFFLRYSINWSIDDNNHTHTLHHLHTYKLIIETVNFNNTLLTIIDDWKTKTKKMKTGNKLSIDHQ